MVTKPVRLPQPPGQPHTPKDSLVVLIQRFHRRCFFLFAAQFALPLLTIISSVHQTGYVLRCSGPLSIRGVTTVQFSIIVFISLFSFWSFPPATLTPFSRDACLGPSENERGEAQNEMK